MENTPNSLELVFAQMHKDPYPEKWPQRREKYIEDDGREKIAPKSSLYSLLPSVSDVRMQTCHGTIKLLKEGGFATIESLAKVHPRQIDLIWHGYACYRRSPIPLQLALALRQAAILEVESNLIRS